VQDLARIAASSVLDPARTSRTTARDMTTLLAAIWRDEAAAPSACARVRAVMTKQVVQGKLASGFSAADLLWRRTVLYAKSGSLFGLVTNEVGVIQEPGDRCYAVAVFTRAHRIYEGRDARDRAIGAAARMAVEALRSQGSARQLSKTPEERGTAER
jgi:beta-lactamase class A